MRKTASSVKRSSFMAAFESYLRPDQWLAVAMIVFTGLLFPFSDRTQLPQNVELTQTKADRNWNTDMPLTAPRIETTDGDEFVATLSATAVYVADTDSGSILLTKNPEELRFPASTTKLMTALVARKEYQLHDVATISAEVVNTDGTKVGLAVGEVQTVENLLKATLISSGNDAAMALALHHPSGLAGFLSEMNQTAHELHLNSTNYTNPAGLDDMTQQASARDLGILAREVMADPVLRSIVRTKYAFIQDQSGYRGHQLHSTHQLLGVVPGVVGIKTGTTQQAGQTLVTQLERDGRSITIVVMGSQDRYADTIAIIDWVFSRYIWVDVAPN